MTTAPHGPAMHPAHTAVDGPRSPHETPHEASAAEILLRALDGATPDAIASTIGHELRALAPRHLTDDDARDALADALQRHLLRAGDADPDALHSLRLAAWWHAGMRLEASG